MHELNRRDFIQVTAGAAVAGGLAASAAPEAPAAGKLPTRVLGKTGLEVPILGFGSGSAFMMGDNAKLTDDQSVELCLKILDAGVTYWDTAAAYGNGESERRLGLALKDPAVRKRVTLATKTGQRSYDGAKREIERSLKLLQTDHVELLQIHNLPEWTKKGQDQVVQAADEKRGAIRAIREFMDQGVIKHFGVTGHSGTQVLIEAVKRLEPETILSTFTAAGSRRPYAEQLLPEARKRGMGVIAMKVMKFGREANRPPEELLRYSLSLDGVCVALVGTDSAETLAKNIETVSKFEPLKPAEMARVEREVRVALGRKRMQFEQPGYVDGMVV